MIKIVLEIFENTIFKLVVTALHCVLETMLGWIFFKVLGLGQTDKHIYFTQLDKAWAKDFQSFICIL